MADTTNKIPEDVMQAAIAVAEVFYRGNGDERHIARAIMAERERTAARLDRAEGLLKRAGEALEPFATEADRYDPDEDDGDLPVWDFEPKTRELRAARAVAREIEEAICHE